MRELSIAQTVDMLGAVCKAVISSMQWLTEVDSKIGDGDHGIGMAGGMEKAKAALAAKAPFADVNTVFKTTGMAMLNSMGGASGVIFGSLFFGGLKGMEPVTALDGATLTRMMRGALNAIKERGKAAVGDKTMVDALEPAVIAMEASENKDLQPLLAAAADAAREGVENTKQCVAKFGKAQYLGERSDRLSGCGGNVRLYYFQRDERLCEVAGIRARLPVLPRGGGSVLDGSRLRNLSCRAPLRGAGKYHLAKCRAASRHCYLLYLGKVYESGGCYGNAQQGLSGYEYQDV